LRIYPDGRFGCCVHPKDREHRKRIWALAGGKKPGTFTVWIQPPARAAAGVSVKAALAVGTLGTLGTGNSELEQPLLTALEPELLVIGTFGTPFINPRAYRKNLSHMYKETAMAVPSVISGFQGREVLSPITVGERLPYLTAGGDLVIPFDSPERYHWWKTDGQRLSVAEIRAEVRAGLASASRTCL
jgi:hypothetical protein